MGVLTKILNRIDGSLIFEAKVDGETESIRLGLAARLKFQKDADLRYANLRYANLQDADLRYADLQYANLQDANLQDADLQDADLRYADLRYANLQDADLQDADLRYANLQDADLQDADLRYADLRSANLQDADLRYADLQDADLRYADLRYANLRYANLQDADLDFSSGITFRCSSFGFKCDFRLIAQIMCHVSRLKSDDPKADKIIKEVGTRWGNEFCQFRSDVEPIQIESPTTGNWPHGYDD